MPYVNISLEHLDRQQRAAIKLLQESKGLEYFDYFWYLGLTEEVMQEHKYVDASLLLIEEQFLKQILPSLASIPSVQPIYKPLCSPEWLPVNQMFGLLQDIRSKKLFQPLERRDVLELGKQVKEETDHELTELADYLLDEEVAEEMVRIWNERYQVAV